MAYGKGHTTGTKRQRPMSARERARLEALGAWIRHQLHQGDQPMDTVYVHVTSIRGEEVWGHAVALCDAGGCAAGAEGYYPRMVATDVEVGRCYEVAEDGTILAELDASE